MWDFKLKSFLKDLKDHAETPPMVQKGCDHPACDLQGEYRAPRSRTDLNKYYWFCIDHVREYNASWDYFKGMSQGEIEHHMYKNAVWDRPTWRMTKAGLNEERAREKIYARFATEGGVFGDFGLNDENEAPQQKRKEAHIDISAIPHPTVEALATMGLAPPIEWEEVRAQYKALAKKYHPDTNKGDKGAEEQFKKINLAYTILKLSYENYSKLEKRE